MKKVLNIIKNILVWGIALLAIGMMIFTIVSVTTFNRNDRQLFGYRAYIVLSDSMSKTDFDAGDLVLVKEMDPSTLKEGDIIACTAKNTNQTISQTLRSVFYSISSNDTYQVGAQHSGMVTATGSNL